MQNVRFGWAAGQPPLINLDSFAVAAGERIFISGPSGCGKSTLLSLIAGVALPDHGRLEILGKDFTALTSAARDRFRADHLGIVFQQFNLIPYLSILENVLLPCQFSAKRRQRIANAGLTPRLEAERLLTHLELDFRVLGKQAAADLSIGQQQRVAVARALIGAPEVIVADEPTSALDDESGGRFVELLLTHSESNATAVVFVSHDTRLASQFDRHIRFSTLKARAAVESLRGSGTS